MVKLRKLTKKPGQMALNRFTKVIDYNCNIIVL